MSNKYHAGTEYTAEQRDQLDIAFQVWLDMESVNEYHRYDYEPARDDAETAYNVYHSLVAKFDAANVSTKRGVATGNERVFTSVKTAQMVAAATSDDSEMIAEMSKVKAIYRAVFVELGEMLDVLMTTLLHTNLTLLSNEELDEMVDSEELEYDIEAADMADMEATYASACNRAGY